MAGPLYEWPSPDAFEEWRMASGSRYEALQNHLSRLGMDDLPARILVPKHYVAMEMMATLPDHWLQRRPYGVRSVEHALIWVWNARSGRQTVQPIFLWDWRTISYRRGIAEWTEDVCEVAVLAEARITCYVCEKPAALPLTNRVFPRMSKLCMPCEALVIAAERMLDDRRLPEMEKLIEATQMVTRGTSRTHRWTRCPESWDEEDWYDGRQRQFKRDVATVVVLVGLAGSGEGDLSGHAAERHQRLADHIRGKRLPANEARSLPCASRGSEDPY